MNNYKIETSYGWVDFKGIVKHPPKKLIKLTLESGKHISCTPDHKIFTSPFDDKIADKFNVGDYVYTKNGIEKIIKIENIEKDYVYDVIDTPNHRFFANDILVHNCEFIGKTNSLINSQVLRQKMNEINEKRITYKFVVDNDVRFYQDINPWKKYLVAIDTAMGVSGDFAAIQIFGFPGFIQVAEWKSDKLNQNEQIEKIKYIIDWLYAQIKIKGNNHPEIYWSLENNGSAEGFICSLRLLDGETPKGYIKNAKLITERGNKRIGFTTTSKTKSMACSQLKILFENNKFNIYSKEYLLELSNFSAKNATTYSATGENHDDLITSSLIIIMMYIQCKNSLDLDKEIINFNTETNDVLNYYDVPFILDCY